MTWKDSFLLYVMSLKVWLTTMPLKQVCYFVCLGESLVAPEALSYFTSPSAGPDKNPKYFSVSKSLQS